MEQLTVFLTTKQVLKISHARPQHHKKARLCTGLVHKHGNIMLTDHCEKSEKRPGSNEKKIKNTGLRIRNGALVIGQTVHA